MKIRSDYVSNSSSSSFVIVGKTYDRSEIRKLIEDRGDELFKMMKESKFSKYCSDFEDINDLIDDWGISKVFYVAGLIAKEEGDYMKFSTFAVSLPFSPAFRHYRRY